MLVNLGVSYKRAPLAILDAVTLRDVPAFYKILRRISGIRESLILQTCNRVELYLDTERGGEAGEKVLWHWALETRFKLGELTRLVDKSEGDYVIEHLVRLAAGLESMLVGENQILGQVRNAVAQARSLATTGPILSAVFEKAISAASRIREQTGIGRGTISLGSAALRVVEETLGKLEDRRVLLVGTGQVGMLVMKALKARSVKDVMVASRTRQRAESFARAFGGTPLELQKVPSQLSRSDLVVVATRATGYLLTKDMIAPFLTGARKGRLMILDLSSPRNVSPDVEELETVSLKTMEDLREIADEALARRKELVKEAEPLVREEVAKIITMLRREEAEPLVSEIYRQADEIREGELGKALSKLKLTPEQQEVLENMSLSMVERLLSRPVVNLRKAAEKGDSKILAVAGQIFGGE